MPDPPRVTAVEFEYAQGLMDMRFLDGSARATLTMSDGKTQTFHWYHDEIVYLFSDFEGKTMEEIRVMHRDRDMKFLQS